MANGEMWDKLFEQVASINARFKPTKAMAGASFVVAFYALLLAFHHEAADHPNDARALKDELVSSFTEAGLRREVIDALSQLLNKACDNAEKLR